MRCRITNTAALTGTSHPVILDRARALPVDLDLSDEAADDLA
jgi:hypothetical protein